jgi:hypothetical protein
MLLQIFSRYEIYENASPAVTALQKKQDLYKR